SDSFQGKRERTVAKGSPSRLHELWLVTRDEQSVEPLEGHLVVDHPKNSLCADRRRLEHLVAPAEMNRGERSSCQNVCGGGDIVPDAQSLPDQRPDSESSGGRPIGTSWESQTGRPSGLLPSRTK